MEADIYLGSILLCKKHYQPVLYRPDAEGAYVKMRCIECTNTAIYPNQSAAGNSCPYCGGAFTPEYTVSIICRHGAPDHPTKAEPCSAEITKVMSNNQALGRIIVNQRAELRKLNALLKQARVERDAALYDMQYNFIENNDCGSACRTCKFSKPEDEGQPEDTQYYCTLELPWEKCSECGRHRWIWQGPCKKNVVQYPAGHYEKEGGRRECLA